MDWYQVYQKKRESEIIRNENSCIFSIWDLLSVWKGFKILIDQCVSFIFFFYIFFISKNRNKILGVSSFKWAHRIDNIWTKYLLTERLTRSEHTRIERMGWYDLFHSSDGPTLYTVSNRTSVTYDVSVVAVCILFATLFFAFVVIFPGIRKQVSQI